ncbi:MAG TPA: hypothetical protein VF771_10880, partial [Longimicrobiaceae bacterium]
MASPASPISLDELRARWEAAWPDAIAAWSRFTRIRPPTLCLTVGEARAEGLTGSFAMIRLRDQAVVISLPEVRESGVENYPVEILAHEIGHHVLAPATLNEHARMIARMRRALPTLERHAPMVANLYTDLLINDRLQRSAGLRLADIYRRIGEGGEGGEGKGGAVWALYMRIYELLWSLERGSLGGGATDDRIEGDAWLGARLIRSYARDWLDGSGRFASLLLPHLVEDERSVKLIGKLLDTRGAAAGAHPDGLVQEDPEEAEGAIHPALDPDLSDLPAEGTSAPPPDVQRNRAGTGQAREPFQYGEILRAAGVDITDHEAAVRYYRERALPYLIPFPGKRAPHQGDPLPEGLEPWELGDPLDAADWLQSVLQSPHVVPGMTTVQRVWGTEEGRRPERIPLELDLYVDSSGSMPNPQQLTSYPALAGAILALSALRAGASVQATLWSGARQFTTTDGFVRDETAILRVLTGYFGGGTAFPIHLLRDTYANRKPGARPAHILVISDNGVTTMFDDDERGNHGWDVAKAALERAGGGGTWVLNMPPEWERLTWGGFDDIVRARDQMGWQVHAVATLEELVAFARWFSR